MTALPFSSKTLSGPVESVILLVRCSKKASPDAGRRIAQATLIKSNEKNSEADSPVPPIYSEDPGDLSF
jgi:hypothetical protein